MNKVIAPLERGMRGDTVANLHRALELLFKGNAIASIDEAMRRRFQALLDREHEQETFGEETARIITLFQREHRLRESGSVDEATARALNELLERLDAFAEEDASPFSARIVSGNVRREDKMPLANIRVRAFHEGTRASVRLGEDTTDAEGRYTIHYKSLPQTSTINLHVAAVSEDGAVLHAADTINGAGALEEVNLTIPVKTDAAKTRRVEGTILLPHGVPAKGLEVKLNRREFGGGLKEVDTTKTLANGAYAFRFSANGVKGTYEIRAVNPGAGGQETPLSAPLDNLDGKDVVTVNLIAPADLLQKEAEYKRLIGDLKAHLDGNEARLVEAKETKDRQDITVLSRATGWDARLIALAATAERMSRDQSVALPAKGLYGLLRVGLPSDKFLLASVPSDTVEEALKKVSKSKIVDLTDAEIGQFKTAFEKFRSAARLEMSVKGSQATYDAFLKQSGLQPEARKRFERVLFDGAANGAALWDKARAAGLSEEQVTTLKLQGKLAFLAGNSEAMTDRLMKKNVKQPDALAASGLYTPAAWKAEVFAQAAIAEDRRNNLSDPDKAKLAAIIPSAYVGEKVENRLEAYAEDMARRVHRSYPTHVVGHLLETDNKFKLPAGHASTVKLLKNVAGKGFRLGQTPVSGFLTKHNDATAGIPADDVPVVTKQLQTLQRVYQITPNDEAMPVLMSLGMTSAFEIMAYPREEFATHFKKKYLDLHKVPPPRDLPYLVYRKAQQVSSVTYNLFTIAKKMETEPAVASLSAPVKKREEVRNELIKHFPTMESLFGSMDFCECDHCRSVLSPAAYLVDLLQFIDTEPGVWANFLAHWQTTHNGQAYPHQDAHGTAMKPYDVLVERRPDLPHLALTCENTHTVLPYIDVVNEILEYFVAHDKLEPYAAHDTGDATTEELLAEPQHVVREAYNRLRDARYPLSLSFDLWIETVREFCRYFETPLDRVLEVLRERDDLFAPAESYDRASVFMESLGLGPAEVAIFVNADPLAKWHELYGYASAADATTESTDATGERFDLNSAKPLSRRLGVTYKELAKLVETRFVNPELAKLIILHKLGVTVQDARHYQVRKPLYDQHKDLIGTDRDSLQAADQLRFDALSATLPQSEQSGWDAINEVAAFEQRFERLAAERGTGVDQLRASVLAVPFDRVLVLADPGAGCDFNQTILRYADGHKVDAIVFLRINLFVRLWRRLGWTIEEVDDALRVFVPKNAPFDAAHLDTSPLKTALIYLSHLKTLDERVRVSKGSRQKLLTLWSDISITGKRSLYAQLFLTRSVLSSDPAFDDPMGRYLNDPNRKLRDHVLSVQGALGLTADEIERILKDAGQLLDDAKLTLPTVSLLYRYAVLAKSLKLSVRELIALKWLSGRNPFEPLHNDPLTSLDQDHAFSHTLKFVEVAEAVKASGFSIEDVEYLLRHHFDEAGKYRSDATLVMSLLRTLAEGIRVIRFEHAIPDDPGSMSDEVLKQKLGLILPTDVVERFFAMMHGVGEFTATTSGVGAADKLVPSTFADEPRIRQVPYNAIRQEQKLTIQGVLFGDQVTSLKAAFNPDLSPAQQGVFAGLLNSVQQDARLFFETHLQKQAAGVQPSSGFLDAADYELIFRPMPSGLTAIEQQERARTRRARLVLAFLPTLQQQLIQQYITQTMTAHTGAEGALVSALITDARLLKVGASGTLLDSFNAVGGRGVDARFFASTDLSGNALAIPSIVASTDTALKAEKDAGGNAVGAANSATFEGYLEVPTAGAYRFTIELEKQGARAELRFRHLVQPLFLSGPAANANATIGEGAAEYLELQPGILYHYRLDLTGLNGGLARMRVQGESLPRAALSQLKLHPATAIQAAEHACKLLAKSLLLVQSLGLSERELRHVMNRPSFGNMNLGQLPIVAVGDTPAERAAVTQRFEQFRLLILYVRLKRELAGGTDEFMGVFEASAAGQLDLAYELLGRHTAREKQIVKSTAEALFNPPTFDGPEQVLRVWEALQVLERFGVPLDALRAWTAIVDDNSTADDRFGIARDLKEAIKVRSDMETWQRIAEPIFNRLRQRQRDALVALVMHKNGFARLEQLYEYFLIDPGMEPVVQTSRIRLAIGSLQLFIQRCLLNLEPKVHPTAINSNHWAWMKRYRVWEANRKIFLFPENWLEPEFRDDKTHLFAELEGALLQGDVSSDLVEDAFFNYLKKLDVIARLDMVAMHIQDDPDPARRVLHVFGRTYSQPHQYFYRRYAHQMWTAWEPVNVEIEGDHLAPVIWRDRLYLFWVTFMDKGPPPAVTEVDPTKKFLIKPPKRTVEAHLHWSEYLNGEWSTPEASGFAAPEPMIRSNLESFDPKSVFVHVSKGSEGGVYIHLHGVFNRAFYLRGRNSAPEVRWNSTNGAAGTRPYHPYPFHDDPATRYSRANALIVNYRERIKTGDTTSSTFASLAILDEGATYTVLPCNNNLTSLGVTSEAYEAASDPDAVKAALEAGLWEIAALLKPVFYQDNKYTFFVEPNVEERSIEQWEEWLTPPSLPEPGWKLPDYWKDIVIIPDEPRPWVDARDPFAGIEFGRDSLVNPIPHRDWLVNPGTLLDYGGALIGPAGQPGLELLDGGRIGGAGAPVDMNPVGALSNGTVVRTDGMSLQDRGLVEMGGGLNVVGHAGFNTAMASNLSHFNGGNAAGRVAMGHIGR